MIQNIGLIEMLESQFTFLFISLSTQQHVSVTWKVLNFKFTDNYIDFVLKTNR